MIDSDPMFDDQVFQSQSWVSWAQEGGIPKAKSGEVADVHLYFTLDYLEFRIPPIHPAFWMSASIVWHWNRNLIWFLASKIWSCERKQSLAKPLQSKCCTIECVEYLHWNLSKLKSRCSMKRLPDRSSETLLSQSPFLCSLPVLFQLFFS